MYVYKANEAYEATKKRAQQKEAIHDFLLTKECTIILTKIKDSIQCGSYRAFLGEEEFHWNKDMIYKCFTELGYKVYEDDYDNIVIDWRMNDKEEK